MEQTIFSNDYYSELLAESEIVPTLHSTLQEEVYNELATEMPREAAVVVSGVVFSVFDESWIEEQIMIVVDDSLLVVTGEKSNFEAVIDLEPKKAELETELKRALDALPDEVLAELGLQPGMTDQLVNEIISDIELPDKIYLSELLADDSGLTADLSAAADTQQARVAYLYLPILGYALFLIFNILLAGFGGGLKWTGSAAFVSGISFLFMLQAVKFLAGGPLRSALTEADFPAIDAALFLLEYTLNRASAVPLYYALAGVVLILFGFLIGAIFKKKTQQEF